MGFVRRGLVRQLVPEDHVLARVDGVLDLGWLGEEATDCDYPDNGRPRVDPDWIASLLLSDYWDGVEST